MNRKILALAIPNIISNITVPLVGMVDMAIVGHLGVDSLIGAMAIGVAIFNFIYWNFAFLRMGTSGLVAQAYGARDFREVGSVFVRSVSVALAVALLLLVARYGVGHLAFRMMDGTPETMREAAEYFYVRLWAAPATLSLFAFQGWFIGMQNSRFPMYISIIVNLLNVAFGFWFVYGLHWGIAGVAWGTVVAQYGGLATASRCGWSITAVSSDMSTFVRVSICGRCCGFPRQPRYFPAHGLYRRSLYFLYVRIVGYGRCDACGQCAADAALHALFVHDGRLRIRGRIADRALCRRPEPGDGPARVAQPAAVERGCGALLCRDIRFFLARSVGAFHLVGGDSVGSFALHTLGDCRAAGRFRPHFW